MPASDMIVDKANPFRLLAHLKAGRETADYTGASSLSELSGSGRARRFPSFARLPPCGIHMEEVFGICAARTTGKSFVIEGIAIASQMRPLKRMRQDGRAGTLSTFTTWALSSSIKRR